MSVLVFKNKMDVIISQEEYKSLLIKADKLEFYEIDKSNYRKHLYHCSHPKCESICLRDHRGMDTYYKCEEMVVCYSCEKNFCSLHMDEFDFEGSVCKKCNNY